MVSVNVLDCICSGEGWDEPYYRRASRAQSRSNSLQRLLKTRSAECGKGVIAPIELHSASDEQISRQLPCFRHAHSLCHESVRMEVFCMESTIRTRRSLVIGQLHALALRWALNGVMQPIARAPRFHKPSMWLKTVDSDGVVALCNTRFG